MHMHGRTYISLNLCEVVSVKYVSEYNNTERYICMCMYSYTYTGGSFVQHLDVGDKTLGSYVQDVLMMDESDFHSTIISTQVCLKHIDSLYNLLRDFTVADIFAKVRKTAVFLNVCASLAVTTYVCLLNYVRQCMRESL